MISKKYKQKIVSKTAILTGVVFLFTIILVHPTYSQPVSPNSSAEVTETIKKGDSAFRIEKYKDALELYNSAVSQNRRPAVGEPMFKSLVPTILNKLDELAGRYQPRRKLACRHENLVPRAFIIVGESNPFMADLVHTLRNVNPTQSPNVSRL